MVMGDMAMTVDVAILGSGPGGYGAAFRAADLGLEVALVDPRHHLGGVCLHEGCIPSKTFLNLAELILESRRAGAMGVRFGEPEIDLARMTAWKEEVIATMATGLDRLCRKRNIQLVRGNARFEGPTTLRVGGGDISRLHFGHAIIATGSTPIPFPAEGIEGSELIMNSTGALQLATVPRRLLIIGGGYVGLELGTVYAALGSEVHLVEMAKRLLPAVDPDLVAPLARRLKQLFARIDLDSAITQLSLRGDGVEATIITPAKELRERFDQVLVAMGRQPASTGVGLENTRVKVDDRGFIRVDAQQRTAEPNIFAVGDVAGGRMLAHTAMREGRVAAEVIAGNASSFDVRAIPVVLYTEPQIAWCGLTEEEAAGNGTPVAVLKFPWKYSGRANSMGATDGLTKLLADPENGRILGAGIVGRDAESLIAEGVMAIEMGALAEDMALSLHPHPTLSETMAETAEIFAGSPTHLLPIQKS
jgi:dihydrolipoamide dehydrogenase